MIDRDGFPRSVNITVRAKTPELIDDAIEQTRQVLRDERGVKPGEEDNFDFFNSHSLITQFNQMTLGVKIARLRHRHHRAGRGRHRHHEHHAGLGDRADQGDRHPQGARRQPARTS